MQAYGYLRVSGATQVDGDGFPRQQEAVTRFCASHSLPLANTFQEDLSGTVESLDRPEFFKLLTIAQPGDCIVVERQDRLARDLMVGELLIRECRDRNIAVFSADRGVLEDIAQSDPDPTRVLIRQLLGALAQWEKNSLVKKLRSAKDRLKRQGHNVEGTTPYGNKAGEKEILKFMLANHPAMGYPEIARMLHSSEFRNRRGGDWTAKSVRMVIVNAREREKRKTNYGS